VDHNQWLLPLWLQCAVVVCLAAMSLISMLLRSPRYYEVPIAAGYFFVMAGFLVLGRTILAGHHGLGWFFFSGLLLGFAVGCRPHLALVCGIVLGAFAVRERGTPKPVVGMAVGMLVCALALGGYNYARFENPLEFGRSYQLTLFPNNPTSTYHGLELNAGALQSAREFLLLAPGVNVHPPFFYAVAINPLAAWPGKPIWLEGSIGLVPAAPFALLGLFAPLFYRQRIKSGHAFDEPSLWLLKTMYWSAIIVFFLLCVVGWILARYLVDFAPILTLEGAVLLAWLWQTIRTRWVARCFAFAVIAITVYGVALNVALAALGLREFLRSS
jgi:hypothetical protein